MPYPPHPMGYGPPMPPHHYGPYNGAPPYTPYGYPPPPMHLMSMPNKESTSGANGGSRGDAQASSKRKSGPKTWTKEEDTILLGMVQNMRMPMKWSIVAQSMPERTGKQCRERYVNHLNPRLKSSDWSPVEDATIFHLYNTGGSQWAKMSKMIPGRTDNGIKNRFHNLRRQLEREDEHRVRLSKPHDFPDEIRLDRIREFPEHLKGKNDDLWEMSEGIGVLAAQSVLGGSFARNSGRFGPFEPAEGEQCARCGFFAPSVQTGNELCIRTKWCQSCTRIPPHMSSNLLRECVNLRRCQEKTKLKYAEIWSKQQGDTNSDIDIDIKNEAQEEEEIDEDEITKEEDNISTEV
uniref:Myb-like DNA-binding domain containing protein n=1 Tax=Eucampia antarctica TaxID=49252 RepID=A0A7S2RUK4_9STRA|mmetsp:Transcript_26994/g.25852  ORF Transcript_26994/g.25852 Transcript_26994/m.25852 type:complete len:349 (+) Transcript_26994:1-1047(+)